MSIKKKFGDIISFLTRPHNGARSLSGIDAGGLLRPGETDELSVAGNLVASFLAVLSGPAAADYDKALRFLEGMKGTAWEYASRFLLDGAAMAAGEIESRYSGNERFRGDFDALHDAVSGGTRSAGIVGLVWRVFFPEGDIGGDRQAAVSSLREKRTISITGLNPEPVTDPGREVLFTANALLTVPPTPALLDGMDKELRHAVEAAMGEEQVHWYDHPVPVGTPAGRNELVYGLGRLSEALRFEESAGLKDPDRDIACVMSVSVTHRALRGVARAWLQSLLAGGEETRGVNLHVFTEEDTVRLLDDVLIPAARRYAGRCDDTALRDVFGVDGEYGRHYNFLKAIARFWSVFVSPEIRATFKIDLDQAFPQEELAAGTGASAFGHLRTPLWGARGTDSKGEAVYLGMIAGALVNRKDIGASLFTPDVPFPRADPAGDEAVFRSSVPQALSTEAEMMTRYGEGRGHDGRTSCIQRVHVTGGTTGILVEALKLYRPFTPSCIGRAEDQAYILSALYRSGERGFLRYAHEPGLVMRHDAELFADAADMARTGKVLGDYMRVLLFSDYARALPWGFDRIKDAVDPFTGCFISSLPITIVYLRFALRAAAMISADDPEALRFFKDGVRRLAPLVEYHKKGENPLEGIYEREKRGWDLYYDVLDAVEGGIVAGDAFALELKVKARALIDSVRINI